MRPGDNKWSITILARDPDTGQAKWAYQIIPTTAGTTTKSWRTSRSTWTGKASRGSSCSILGRTGFMFVFDRATGELLSAENFVPIHNWANGFDLKTGLPMRIPRQAPPPGKLHRGHLPVLHGRQGICSFLVFSAHRPALHSGA